jgi:hypothetical protein
MSRTATAPGSSGGAALMSGGTGPSFHEMERAPRISHSGQIQSSFATARGRRAPGGPGGGGGMGMSGGQTRTHAGWNPRSQESHRIIASRISGWPQDAQGIGGCPQPTSSRGSARGGVESPTLGSNPTRKFPVAPKGAVLQPGNENRRAASSASCWL